MTQLDKIKNFVELNFNYIYNDDQLQTIITQIKDDYYNDYIKNIMTYLKVKNITGL